MSLSASSLKEIACQAIDAITQELHEVSQEIWRNPELSFEERHAHQVLTDFLEAHGFPVERSYVLSTGFRAVVDHGDGSGATAAVLCEYDALPGVGHACGHHLIAEVGAGAAVGIKAAMDAAAKHGQKLGKLHVLGTPAEEDGNGKVHMIKAGTFKTVDFAMMCHPAPFGVFKPDQSLICVTTVRAKFHGKASHAAAFPWEGVNALDAAVMAYNSISVLRQQLRPTWRIHGVITNGGAKPNIIPEVSEMQYYIRTPTRKELDLAKVKVTPCFEAAAMSTGCTVDISWERDSILNVISNRQLIAVFENNASALGVEQVSSGSENATMVASTDMGNVSYEVPSIHPLYKIQTDSFNHARGFTVDAGATKAQAPTIAQAKALAMTAIDMFCQPELVTKMKEQFKEDMDAALAVA